MKRYLIIAILLAISIGLLFMGAFGKEDSMKENTIGLILLMLVSIYLSKLTTKFLDTKGNQLNFAVSTAYAFFSLIIIVAVLFTIDTFITPIVNLDFIIFGSIFVSVIVSRLYLAYELKEYL
ncbi:MAG: hypothetical protein ABII22_01960 [Candidatus Micrarchaeota archaeon]